MFKNAQSLFLAKIKKPDATPFNTLELTASVLFIFILR
ncbi:hypothetical protein RV06_GL002365 [Enterococcus haemoperoxidus]|nr:hypothetical protein RV06_GL002365 [Enterococcus haemoperoxidus]